MAGKYLPGVLGYIAEEIGEEIAVQLAKSFGGRAVYLPKEPRADGRLARKIGLANAQRLSNLLGAGDLLVPCGDFAGNAGRKRCIEALHLEGLSHSQIAEELDVHIRTVERTVAKLRASNQSMLPFG